MTKDKGYRIVGSVNVGKDTPPLTTAIGVNLGTVVTHHSNSNVSLHSQTVVHVDIEGTRAAIQTLREAGLHNAADILEKSLNAQMEASAE